MQKVNIQKKYKLDCKLNCWSYSHF